MFGHRYFGVRFYGPRYYGPGVDGAAAGDGGGVLATVYRRRVRWWRSARHKSRRG
jgi:hypothetical protein